MAQVTDPQLLAILNGGASAPVPVSDPALIAELNSLPGVLKDAAKSLGVGVAEGAISTIGAPGDLQGYAADAASGWLDRKADEYFPALTKFLREESAKTAKGPIGKALSSGTGDIPAIGLPTTEQIKAPIESVTGEFYKPQTKLGEYSRSIGQMVPGSLTPAGRATVLMRGLSAAGAGIGAQALGDYTEGTALEPYARFGGAVFGALGGHQLGKTVPGTRNYVATKSAANEAAQVVGENIPTGAMRRVADSVKKDGLTPQSVAARQAELGNNEAMLLDMGRQVGGRAEAIASQPGRGQNIVLNAVENRTGTFGDQVAARTKRTLDTEMGRSQDVVQLQKRVENIVDSYAHPAYQRVMGQHPEIWDSALENLAQRPAIRQAMNDAVSLAKNYGETIANPFPKNPNPTQLGAPGAAAPSVTSKPSLQYWDYVKKAIDARINKMMKGGGIEDLGSKDKADLGGLIAAKNALVEHLDTVTNGAYANARKLSATKFELREAADVGRGALNSKLLPEELADQLRGMSLPEQAMAQAHFRREIDRIIDSARNDGAAARRILDTNNNRQKIETVFGSRALDEIDRRIAAETHFQTTKQKIADNSRTAVRQELNKDTSTQPVGQALSTSLPGMLHAAGRGGLNYLREQGMERTRDGIAALLTSKGDDMRRLIEIMTSLNASRAARAPAITGANLPQSLVFGALAPMMPRNQLPSQ